MYVCVHHRTSMRMFFVALFKIVNYWLLQGRTSWNFTYIILSKIIQVQQYIRFHSYKIWKQSETFCDIWTQDSHCHGEGMGSKEWGYTQGVLLGTSSVPFLELCGDYMGTFILWKSFTYMFLNNAISFSYAMLQ